MKLKTVLFGAAALVGTIAAAWEPYNVEGCGFPAAPRGLYHNVWPRLDCLLWSCFPFLDTDCAGVVYAGESKGEHVWFITWNADSLAAARSRAKGMCESKGLRNCHQLLEFRHAGAVYHTGPGERLYVGQAIDLATAKEIARGRCERATGSRCQLVVAKRNRNAFISAPFGPIALGGGGKQ